MKALNFVIGMLVGMVLLVVAIFGAVFAAGSLVSVGQLENTLGTDVFDDESSVNDLTMLELVQKLIGDLQDPDNLTISKLKSDYGLKIPDEISGIDISPLFGYPISEVPDHLGDVVNNMTLRDVGEFLGMDFEKDYPELLVLQENLDNNVNVALDNVLSSIDDEKMTIYTIERDFGLSLGENNLTLTLRHTPLSSFAAVMDNLPVGVVTDADSDLFVEDGSAPLYVVTDAYEEVPSSDISSSAVTDGAETYIAGADDNGLVYREVRYVKASDGSFVVNNDCYASSFDPSEENVTFYRHIVYVAFDADTLRSGGYGEDTVFAVRAYLNDFVPTENGGYALADGGMVTLDTVFGGSADFSGTLNDYILNYGASSDILDGNGIDFSAATLLVTVPTDDGGAQLLPAEEFGLADGVTPDDSTRLDDRYSGYLRIHVGEADPAMQIIAGETITSVSGATDKITSLKLGEVLDIDADSAKILRTLANTPINEMSDALDTITLADATDIVLSAYTEDPNGSYVKISSPLSGVYYTLYNPSEPSHEGLTRYSKSETEGEASAALQRLSGVTIPNISAAFGELVLGDALNVDVDRFAPASTLEKGETYFIFGENGYPVRVVYGVDDVPADTEFFVRTYEGESNAVLKQLAYVNINDVSAAMDDIIENTLLSDIIDVTSNTVAAYAGSSDATGWLFEADPVFSDDGKAYTFVYDGSGKYYMTDVIYLPATEGQKEQFRGEAFSFTYEANSGYDNVRALLTARGANIFFADGNGGYTANPALLAYYISAGLTGKATAITALKNTFSRVESAAGETAYHYVAPSSGEGGLYVYNEGSLDGTTVSFGGYVPYDENNPTHWGADVFFKYSDGYYPASSAALAEADDIGIYTYTPDGGFAPTSVSAGSGTDGYYVKLDAKFEDGRTEADGNTPLALYYFTAIDGGFKETYTVYSKRECDYIFVENAASGGWVNVSGEWTEYDQSLHGDVEMRYDRYLGYIGNDAANTGGIGLDPLTDIAVNVLEEKSPTILISLLNKQVTIGSLNSVIDSLTIGEMMEIEPGSVFDNDILRNATVDSLSHDITAMFTTMTIGELLTYANVSVSEEISFVLKDVTVTKFFGALEYKDGAITVNMEKLFLTD